MNNALSDCPAAVTQVSLSVTVTGGVPADGFTAQFEERDRGIRTTLMEVPSGSHVAYGVTDPSATLIVLVQKAGYYPGLAVVPPIGQAQESRALRSFAIQLIEAGECLGVLPGCAHNSGSGQFVPGELIVGVNDWLSNAEIATILAPYCLPFTPSDACDSFAMWVDVTSGNANAVIAKLEASGLVQWAEVRGWPCGQPSGTPVIVQFTCSASLNAARELIASLDGVRWLETIRPPKWALASVPPGSEGEWACTLSNDPNVEYAEPNFILCIQEEFGCLPGLETTAQRGLRGGEHRPGLLRGGGAYGSETA